MRDRAEDFAKSVLGLLANDTEWLAQSQLRWLMPNATFPRMRCAGASFGHFNPDDG